MITGKYTVSIDGEIVHEESNIITNAGRLAILRYLAGISNTYAGAIAVGVSDTVPTLIDTTLGFEVYQAPIILKTVDYNNSQILFKASFPAGDQYTVYEIGIFPEDSNNRGSLIHYFDSSESWTGATETDLSHGRIGEAAIVLNTTGTASKTISNDSQINLSSLQPNDKIELAALFFNDSCDHIRVQFTDINGDVMYCDYDTSAINGDPDTPVYEILSYARSAYTNQDKEWGQIVLMEVIVTGTASTKVALDGFRTTDSNILTGSEIVSKTRLASPVVKDTRATLDVQYSMSVPI